ncbi:MAG: hypothetical protein ACM3ML_37095 [Micromonosporaceae bacterium]
MSKAPPDVPVVVRTKALAAGAAQWIGDLPELVASLERDRSIALVDPDGLLAEAEYDMGILMLEDSRELLHGDGHERAQWLARALRLDATAILQWGVVERVSTGLLCTKIGLQPAGRELLAVADRDGE